MNLVVPGVGPELHDGRDDLGGDLWEFGDERRGERFLHLRLVFSEAAGAVDLASIIGHIPKIISKAQKIIIKDPATAKEFTSIPKRTKIFSPKKKRQQ